MSIATCVLEQGLGSRAVNDINLQRYKSPPRPRSQYTAYVDVYDYKEYHCIFQPNRLNKYVMLLSYISIIKSPFLCIRAYVVS